MRGPADCAKLWAMVARSDLRDVGQLTPARYFLLRADEREGRACIERRHRRELVQALHDERRHDGLVAAGAERASHGVARDCAPTGAPTGRAPTSRADWCATFRTCSAIKLLAVSVNSPCGKARFSRPPECVAFCRLTRAAHPEVPCKLIADYVFNHLADTIFPPRLCRVVEDTGLQHFGNDRFGETLLRDSRSSRHSLQRFSWASRDIGRWATGSPTDPSAPVRSVKPARPRCDRYGVIGSRWCRVAL